MTFAYKTPVLKFLKNKTIFFFEKTKHFLKVWIKVRYLFFQEQIKIWTERSKLQQDLKQEIECPSSTKKLKSHKEASLMAVQLRSLILKHAGVPWDERKQRTIDDLKLEISFLRRHSTILSTIYLLLRPN